MKRILWKIILMTEDAALGMGDNCDHHTVKSPGCTATTGLIRCFSKVT